MHDGLQIGTIALVLCGIVLRRYDISSLRKEMQQGMGDLRKDMSGFRSELRKDLSDLRAEVHRSTTLITEMLFGHAERITKLENK